MILAEVTSTSTRLPVVPPARKKRHRSDPTTSTSSPGRQVTMLLRRRDVHAAHGTESDRRPPPRAVAEPRWLVTRNMTTTSPLGSSRETGTELTRPVSRTTFASGRRSSSRPPSGRVVLVVVFWSTGHLLARACPSAATTNEAPHPDLWTNHGIPGLWTHTG